MLDLTTGKDIWSLPGERSYDIGDFAFSLSGLLVQGRRERRTISVVDTNGGLKLASLHPAGWR